MKQFPNTADTNQTNDTVITYAGPEQSIEVDDLSDTL